METDGGLDIAPYYFDEAKLNEWKGVLWGLPSWIPGSHVVNRPLNLGKMVWDAIPKMNFEEQEDLKRQREEWRRKGFRGRLVYDPFTGKLEPDEHLF